MTRRRVAARQYDLLDIVAVVDIVWSTFVLGGFCVSHTVIEIV